MGLKAAYFDAIKLYERHAYQLLLADQFSGCPQLRAFVTLQEIGSDYNPR